MSRVITFSRFFPKGHPKEGQPTYFIEKLYASFADSIPDFKIPNTANEIWDWHTYYNATPKHHTVRKGFRWKVGDKFSPRVWSGKPYNTKQIILCPDIEVKKVWNFYKEPMNEELLMEGNDVTTTLPMIAKNDGLELEDFKKWFPKPFSGQIICWSDKVVY